MYEKRRMTGEMSLEACIHVKRDVYTCLMRLIRMKRDVYTYEQRPMTREMLRLYVSFHTYIRDLRLFSYIYTYIRLFSYIYTRPMTREMLRQACVYVKRDLSIYAMRPIHEKVSH